MTTGTPSLGFCFTTDRFRPGIVAAIRSAMVGNPSAEVHVFCDGRSRFLYEPRFPSARFVGLETLLGELRTDRVDIAARKARALVLVRHGGWYLDAFDTLTLRELPEVDRFTIGEECWDGARLCSGVCAAPPGSAFARAWLDAMLAVPDRAWNHWTDQVACAEVARSGAHAVTTLPTGVLNWPSETGFVGEIRLSEEQVAWVSENAWVLHYFGRGAFGQAYKDMDLATLRRCGAFGGWIPRMLLSHIDEATPAV